MSNQSIVLLVFMLFCLSTAVFLTYETRKCLKTIKKLKEHSIGVLKRADKFEKYLEGLIAKHKDYNEQS